MHCIQQKFMPFENFKTPSNFHSTIMHTHTNYSTKSPEFYQISVKTVLCTVISFIFYYQNANKRRPVVQRVVLVVV